MQEKDKMRRVFSYDAKRISGRHKDMRVLRTVPSCTHVLKLQVNVLNFVQGFQPNTHFMCKSTPNTHFMCKSTPSEQYLFIHNSDLLRLTI